MTIQIKSNTLIADINGCNGIIAVGKTPLSSLVTTAGCNNIAIGDTAGSNLTTGKNNTIIGNVNAPTTTSVDTVIIGAGSTERLLVDNVKMLLNSEFKVGYTGLDNLYIGKSTLDAIITVGTTNDVNAGYENIAIGSYALKRLTTGKNNIAIGDDSSMCITTESINLAIGRGALGYAQAGCNIAIGNNAILCGTGGFNLGIGADALLCASTGVCNVALGHKSFAKITSGSNNIGLGVNVGSSIITGSNNTIIGNLAGTGGLSNTILIGTGTTERIKMDANAMVLNDCLRIGAIGNDNTFIGKCALGNITVTGATYTENGNGNTAIGSIAMKNLTTGNMNTAVGDDSLTCNQTGSHNVAIGRSALRLAEAGCNIAIGSAALSSTDTDTYYRLRGHDNIGIGLCTMFKNCAGHCNISLGNMSLSNILTGCNNIVIGQAAGICMTGGENNNTIIGNLPGITGACNTLFIGTGSCQRIKIDSTGFYVNDATIPIGVSGVLGLDTNYSIKIGSGALAVNSGLNNVAVGINSLHANVSGANNISMGCSALCCNNSGNDNVAFGYNTLGASVTGSDSIAIGNNALTKSNSSGKNIALGKNAGCDVTTGTNNTILGSLPGTTDLSDTVLIGAGTAERLKIDSNNDVLINNSHKISFGMPLYENMAIGRCALEFNTPQTCVCVNPVTGCSCNVACAGDRNLALGPLALRCNTTGRYNTGIGDDALVYNTTGGWNIGIGAVALSYSNACHNVAVGNGALSGFEASYVTGCHNTAVGNYSLRNNQSGELNTAFGNCALYCNTTGSENTAFGPCALFGNTSGKKNVVMGSCTGRAITTGSYNTVIGYFASDATGTYLDKTTAGMNNTILIGAGCNYLKLDTNGEFTVNGDVISGAALDSAGNFKVGAQSLSQSSHGNDNIAIGCCSLTAASGSCNIALGMCAGFNLTTGANNTIIGNLFGSNNLSNTVLIGAGTCERLKIDSAALTINNTIRVGGTTGTGNTFVGSGSLSSLNPNSPTGQTNGNCNTAVGFNALNKLTTGILNIAMGMNAIGCSITGSDNLAIGTNSLQFSQASQNIAIGCDALKGSSTTYVTGSNNIAIGAGTLKQNTSGACNIAIGPNAGLVNTLGDNSVLIGCNAGCAATSGSKNTIIGVFDQNIGTASMHDTVLIGAGCNYLKIEGTGSLTVNGSSISSTASSLSMDSSNNLAIGTSALAQTSHGQHNVGIGVNALTNNAPSTAGTGCLNIAIGCNAGCTISTGKNNTIIGNLSGSAGLTDTVLIGAGANERLKIDSTAMVINNSLRMGSTGTNNTFVGVCSLCNINTTVSNVGDRNTAFGNSTLSALTTGSQNVAIGDIAMGSSLISISNIAIGTAALRYGSSCRNIAIGVCTLSPDTTGAVTTTGCCNIAVGHTSLKCISSGNRNIAIGDAAGSSISTGNDNVIIGNYTGTVGLSNTVCIKAGCQSLSLDSTNGFLINGSGVTASVLNTTGNYQIGSLGVGTAASGVLGEIRATSTITANYSDDRLKTRLGNITNALEKVLSLNGFYYNANDVAQSFGYKVKAEVGVSAQEVQAILPEIVVPAPIDDRYLTVHYEKLVPLLIEAIKDLNTEIENIKKSI